MRSGRSAALDVTTYAYDASKRLTSVSSVDGTQIRYSYNAAGSIVSRVVGKVTDVVNALDVDASACGGQTRPVGRLGDHGSQRHLSAREFEGDFRIG